MKTTFIMFCTAKGYSGYEKEKGNEIFVKVLPGLIKEFKAGESPPEGWIAKEETTWSLN